MSKFLTLILTIAALLTSFNTRAQSNVSNYITDPAVSLRCKELLKEREKRLSLKQKVRALIKRNQEIRRKLDKNKVSLKNKLRFNHTKLMQEERLLLLKLENLEEEIIRTGCPGIIQ